MLFLSIVCIAVSIWALKHERPFEVFQFKFIEKEEVSQYNFSEGGTFSSSKFASVDIHSTKIGKHDALVILSKKF
jgi:hypothetical protein